MKYLPQDSPGGRPCPLCLAERRTRRYHEDEVCWVAECDTCGVPMAVLRRHTAEPSAGERAHVEAVLRALFPRSRLDGRMRTHPEHYHIHAR